MTYQLIVQFVSFEVGLYEVHGISLAFATVMVISSSSVQKELQGS